MAESFSTKAARGIRRSRKSIDARRQKREARSKTSPAERSKVLNKMLNIMEENLEHVSGDLKQSTTASTRDLESADYALV